MTIHCHGRVELVFVDEQVDGEFTDQDDVEGGNNGVMQSDKNPFDATVLMTDGPLQGK